MSPAPDVRRPRRLAALGVVLLAALPFAPSLGNDFALDDVLARETIEGAPNPTIAALRGPSFYFTSDYWAGIGARSGLYRPATVYSFALTHHLVPRSAELEALPHHAINVLLHCLAAWLVLWLMLDFGLPLLGAALTAGLFAVHAVHSEVVATVVGRAELLAFCFGLLAVRVLRAAAGPPAWQLALSSALLFLAFCSKESALAWVGFLPCYALARGWRRGVTAGATLRATWRPSASALVPAILLYFVLRQVAVPGPAEPTDYAANPLFHADAAVRLLTALQLWGYGLWLCVAPFSLACLYGPQAPALVESAVEPGVLATAALFTAWLGAALWRPARRPGLFLTAAVFFGFGFITSNIPFPIGTIFAERLFYTPSLGVCMLPALLVGWLAPGGRRVLLGACVAWAAACAVVDVQRSLAWRDSETLLTREADAHPDCALLQLTAAKYFHHLATERPAAKEAFRQKAWAGQRRALALDPEYVDAYALQALLLASEGDADGAIKALRAALAIPRLPHTGREAPIRGLLGRLLLTEKKQLSTGLAECVRSLELDPKQTDLRVLTVDFGMTRLPRDAVARLLQEGREREPNNPVFAVQMAEFLARTPQKTARLMTEIATILGAVFAHLPARRHAERRFVVARIVFAESLAALGRAVEARRELQLVAGMEGAPPDMRTRAAGMLQALPRGR